MAGASIIRTPTHTFYTNYSQFTRNPFQLQKPISNFDAALKSNERFGPLLGLHLYVLLLKSGDQYFQMGLMLRVNKQETGYKASSTERQNTFLSVSLLILQATVLFLLLLLLASATSYNIFVFSSK